MPAAGGGGEVPLAVPAACSLLSPPLVGKPVRAAKVRPGKGGKVPAGPGRSRQVPAGPGGARQDPLPGWGGSQASHPPAQGVGTIQLQVFEGLDRDPR